MQMTEGVYPACPARAHYKLLHVNNMIAPYAACFVMLENREENVFTTCGNTLITPLFV